MQVTIFLVFQTSKLLNLSLKLRLLLGLEDRQKKKTNFGSSLLILKPFSLTAYFQRWQRHATLISAQKREKKHRES